nr:ABC transporter permease [Chloroflexota bacterium]
MWGRLPLLTPLLLAVRNMSARWMRTLLTCLGIVLGVAVILAIAVTNDSTLLSIRNVFDEASGKANLLVQSSSADGGGFDQSALPRAQSTAGVVASAPAVSAFTLLASDAENWQIAFGIGGVASGSSLQILGVDPDIDQQVRQYDLTAGRWLQADAYEAVITEKYAADKHLALGEDLAILVPGGEERLRIVGLVARSGAGLLNEGIIAFAPLNVVQDLFNRGSEIDEIAVVTSPDIANSPPALETLKATLAARLGKNCEVIYPAARGQLVTQMLSTYQQGLSFFSVVALFVGAFLIYNAFSMTVLERTREMGLLRAIGMTRAQIIQMVLSDAVILAGIGSVLGVGFGLVLARGLILMLGAVVAREINSITIPPSGLGQSLIIGALVTLGSSLWPALQAAATSPLEALRVAAKTEAGGSRGRYWFGGLTLIFSGWAALYRIPWR